MVACHKYETVAYAPLNGLRRTPFARIVSSKNPRITVVVTHWRGHRSNLALAVAVDRHTESKPSTSLLCGAVKIVNRVWIHCSIEHYQTSKDQRLERGAICRRMPCKPGVGVDELLKVNGGWIEVRNPLKNGGSRAVDSCLLKPQHINFAARIVQHESIEIPSP